MTISKILTVTREFVSDLEHTIRSSDDNDCSVRLASWLARFLFSNSCGIYHLKGLEDHLAARLAESLDFTDAAGFSSLHVASELYMFGGHSRLMRNLLAAAPQGEPRQVAVTRHVDQVNVAQILGVELCDVTIFSAESEGERIRNLASYFVKFEQIILHIHPDDMIAAIAVAIAKSVAPALKVYFINHSDHTFSAGIGQGDFVFEVSGYGWSLRNARGTEARSTFLGIPIVPRAESSDPRHRMVLTGGAAYKYRPNAGRALPTALYRILHRDKSARVLAIGPKRSDYWWWILKIMFPKRFQLRERVPHATYLAMLGECRVYVDSYPITGGTGFTEALISGALVAGIQGGPNGYGFGDVLRSQNAEEFVEVSLQLLNLDHAALLAQAGVREAAREFHSLSSVSQRFFTTLRDGRIVLPPDSIASFSYDFDFRTAWMTRRVPICAGFSSMKELSILPWIVRAAFRSFGLDRFLGVLFLKLGVAFVRKSRHG